MGAAPELICANWTPDNPECETVGRFSCKNCLLVLYCGSKCQKSHWILHKSDCRSPLGKKTWSPDWVLENRDPVFVRNGPGVQFGRGKYLWGNVPAFDVVQLASNEGENYGEPLRLLFAASGDVRNIVKTIAQLPSSYVQRVDVTMNDRDIDIVARNVILLLVALVVDDVDAAINCIIHVWYSARICKSHLDVLQQRIRPLIQTVCDKIKSKPPESLQAKTWSFGEQRSLRLVLTKSSWGSLLSFLDTPEGLTEEQAHQIRRAVTMAESRKDYRDRSLLCQPSPARRVASIRFREDGLLLPFGSPRRDSDFVHPNPTFFQTANTWPMFDNADPLHGWSLKEVEDCPNGPATADIYGKLHCHITTLLRQFLLRVSSSPISFRLFQMDATDLSEHLEMGSFDRVEVSNISDGGYLGIHRILQSMIPLLRNPIANPHATLITLFMNAVDECLTDSEKNSLMDPGGPTMDRLFKYLPPQQWRGPPTKNSPDSIKFVYANDLVATYEKVFDRYMTRLGFREVGEFIGAAMKDEHTIVENWPFRLKLQPGQPGAQEEFDSLLAGGMSGKERYVEWKRIGVYGDEHE
ncbi:hypothetical protein B0H66DRAFT_511247 [Apodospora peruviana]|uniref:MYND-type domain-containing protein n=1 Tax=Apodospora peruviana TaxID=516989 RepID=A0AAE0MBH8_9PEZI|nr:hypothetical protein B0H66DRAFT_511247 [Apodospora peruviana]